MTHRSHAPCSMLAAVLVLTLSACAGPAGLAGAVEATVSSGPGRGSDAYRTPDPLEAHQLAGAVLAVLAAAEEVGVPAGTQLEDATDGRGRRVQVLTEDTDGGAARGLGAYAARPGAGAPAGLVVEVPHPRADQRTEELGPALFAALDADALLVAGAHRTAGDGSADVAHQPDSAFAAVDRAVVGRGSVVLQLHGFDESRHPGSGDVVVSSTEARPGALVRRLAMALEEAGLETCVYDGGRCAALAGTRNVQAAHARSVGATFVHLELAAPLRADGPARDRFVEALTQVLAR